MTGRQPCQDSYPRHRDLGQTLLGFIRHKMNQQEGWPEGVADRHWWLRRVARIYGYSDEHYMVRDMTRPVLRRLAWITANSNSNIHY
jgi:hypothetical protein